MAMTKKERAAFTAMREALETMLYGTVLRDGINRNDDGLTDFRAGRPVLPLHVKTWIAAGMPALMAANLVDAASAGSF